MDIAKAVRVGLAKRNKKRTWLAEQLDVTPQYVSSLCNGNKKVSMARVEELARLFGVSDPEFIKWGEDD